MKRLSRKDLAEFKSKRSKIKYLRCQRCTYLTPEGLCEFDIEGEINSCEWYRDIGSGGILGRKESKDEETKKTT